MNAKTLEAVERHGRQLLAIFPNATERDPVALCKKLRRVEAVAEKYAMDLCNGTLDLCENEQEEHQARIMDRVFRLLGNDAKGLRLNLDPRGYALKIDDQYMRDHNIELHRDMGGYGIIAPDLTEGK